jgi:hypothetical protein
VLSAPQAAVRGHFFAVAHGERRERSRDDSTSSLDRLEARNRKGDREWLHEHEVPSSGTKQQILIRQQDELAISKTPALPLPRLPSCRSMRQDAAVKAVG